MLLYHRRIDGEIARTHILVRHRHQRDVRKIVVSFHLERTFHAHPARCQRMPRNLHSFPSSQLAHRLQHFGLSKVRSELQFLPIVNNGIPVRRRGDARFIQRQLFPILQQKCLHRPRWQNLKLRRARSQHHRPAIAHLYLNVRWSRRARLRPHRRPRATQTQPRCSNQQSHRDPCRETTHSFHSSLALLDSERYHKRTKDNKSRLKKKERPCGRGRPAPELVSESRSILSLVPKGRDLFPRPCTLHISPQPVIHLPEHIQHTLPPRIPMRLQRQQHKPHGAARAFDGAEKPLALDRKRARIVVRLAVNQQNRCLDLVGVRKW